MKRKASAKAQPKVKAPSLYPWRFRTLVFFIGILLVAYLYALGKGALNWHHDPR